MNAVLYGLIGAAIFATLIFICWSGKAAWAAVQAIIGAIVDLGRQMKLSMQAANALVTSNKKAMENLSRLEASNKKQLEALEKLIAVASKVGTELEMLRSVFMAPQTAADGTPIPSEDQGKGPLRPGLQPFPKPFMANYVPAEEHVATVDETEVESTEDSDMADLEKIQYQRDQGFEVEEPEIQPGIVAESN